MSQPNPPASGDVLPYAAAPQRADELIEGESALGLRVQLLMIAALIVAVFVIVMCNRFFF